jgi:Asp-tRNA(Asn)/Glu-tRNA(Gln) amidotransferase A subunit family amidase
MEKNEDTDMTSLATLSALEAALGIAAGEFSSQDLVSACVERIAEMDEQIGAWTYLDVDYALAQAKAADEHRQSGLPTGSLLGLPVAVKDIFDTADMPTECGTPVYTGRTPTADSTVVAFLRQAGAIIMGKSVTTELAMYSPGKTRNPHDPERTPGGSSSGSAAAVASGMVPLAIGSQTAGSIIRPASFCGTVGFKPTHGRISRHGALMLSRTLDTVGVFGRTVEDVALIGDALSLFDTADPDMKPTAPLGLLQNVSTEPPVEPVFAFVKSPVWEKAGSDVKSGFEELADALGNKCDEVELPEPFDHAIDLHRTIMIADIAKNIGPLYDKDPTQLSEPLRGMVEAGRAVKAVDYTSAYDLRKTLNAGLDQIFSRYDAIVTPAATGDAPKTLDYTGNPIFCSLWTYCGVPAVSLPLLTSTDDMPIGVQLVGQRGYDGRLLRTARWLTGAISNMNE